MELEEVYRRANDERRLESRFPARVILVEDFSQYQEIVHRLTQVCDETCRVSRFCSTPDTYPNFFRLNRWLDQCKNKQILLLGMGEYLRLAAKRETDRARAQFKAVWERQEESISTTRVIMPMFACSDLFRRVVPTIDERQAAFLWEVDPPPTQSRQFTLTVYSSAFAGVVQTAHVPHGIQGWLDDWEALIQKGEHSIETALFGNVEQMSGLMTVRVIDDPFAYVMGNTDDGHRLERSWGTDSQWAAIIDFCVKGAPFSNTILKGLNLMAFDPLSVLAQWTSLDQTKKWLVWLWYRVNDSDDYYGYVFRQMKSLDHLETGLRDCILSAPSLREDWIAQRADALRVLRTDAPDDGFFKRLEARCTTPEARLALLTGQTHRERAFAIKTAGEWLRKGGALNVVADEVRRIHPLLATYVVDDAALASTDLQRYFCWYRLQKLQNTCPDASSVPQVDLDGYDSRFSKIKLYEHEDCVFFWVDGMGAEWLPLLTNLLETRSTSVSVNPSVVAALLPTDTEHNAQWVELGLPYLKWDRLDRLSHSGTPDNKDYYSCIDDQLSVISDVANKALELASLHNYVIVTGDHGSSRIAALFFHNTPGIIPPKESEPRSFGRYCELQHTPVATEIPPEARRAVNGNRHFLVMRTHEHFRQSGNAAGGNKIDDAVAGEVHGGMTAEEYLVPFIVIKRRVPLVQLDYEIENAEPYRTPDGVKLSLEFNRPITTLEASFEHGKGLCTMIDGDRWTVLFKDIDLGPHTLTVVANGKVLTKRRHFVVKAKGITINQDPFGGLL